VDYLLPIADREALAWIVRTQQTALPGSRVDDARRVAARDRFFLYTTRGCFRNPTRDRGRVIATAVVSGVARELAKPVSFGGRSYTIGIRFKIESLARLGEGVELAPLVPQLDTFPDPTSWSARLRRALVPLIGKDGDLLARELLSITHPFPEARETYKRP
jgi:hypothetical protein